MKKNLTSIQRFCGGTVGLSSIFLSSATRVFKLWGGKLLVCANGLAVSRFAVVLSRGFPSSVVRNKTKRWVKEHIRQEYKNLPGGWDLVIVLYFSPEKKASCYRSLVTHLFKRSSLVDNSVS